MRQGLLALIFLITSLNLHAQAEGLIYYKSRGQLPHDFALALEHLQITTRSPAPLLQQIVLLDQLFGHINEEERLFFPKTELYKALLRNARIEVPRLELFEKTSLKIMSDAIQAAPKDSFAQFFYASLLSDLQTIMETPGYNTFLSRLRSAPNQLDGDFINIKRRLDLILPWVGWYQLGGQELVDRKLMIALNEMIDALVARLQDLLFLSRFSTVHLRPQQQGDLVYFEQRPLPKILNAEQTSSTPSVEQAIDELLEQTPTAPVTSEEWTPKVDIEEFFNPTPTPDYIAPEILPSPINDWLQEGL